MDNSIPYAINVVWLGLDTCTCFYVWRNIIDGRMTDNDPKVWYHIDDKFVCIPARCGSTSFEKTVGRQEKFAEHGHPAYLAIRHPVDRFVSWWRFCHEPNWKYASSGDIRYFHLHTASPNNLMDVIEENPLRNRHWLPQATYYSEGVTVVPFERMLEHLGYEPLHKNRSITEQPPYIPVDRILAHYADDLALYEQAKKLNP